MFIRKANTRTSKSGTTYYTHRLCHNTRTGDSVRQEILLNLGTYFNVKQEYWQSLCTRIKVLWSRQTEMGFAASLPIHVEATAQWIVAKLFKKSKEKVKEREEARKKQEKKAKAQQKQEPEAPWPSVDPAQDPSASRTVGVEHVSLWAIEKLELDTLLQSLGLTPAMQKTVLGQIVGRMAAPSNDRDTHHWLANKSGLGEFLGYNFANQSSRQLYRASDVLHKHWPTIEDHLFTQAMKALGTSPRTTLYDLANTYLEGSGKHMRKAARGYSKEKRYECPLLTLGMLLDQSGLVRRSRVFPGNVCEAKTLEPMLKGGQVPSESIIVMDRGIATEDRLRWLRDQGYRYVVASRRRKRFFNADEAEYLTSATGTRLALYREEKDGEVYVRVHSRPREAVEKAMVEKLMKRYEAELHKIKKGLSRPYTHKRPSVIERVSGV